MTFVRSRLSFAMLALIAFASAGVAIGQQTDVYFASQIWTGTDQPISNGAMLVVDGRITAVGPRADVQVPAVATEHDLGQRTIIPGMIAVQTALSGATGEDKTLTPSIRALDGFDFFADRESLLKSGITTVQVSPSSARLMPGVGGVALLEGDEISERVLSEIESLRIVLSSSARNPPRIYEPEVGPVSDDRPLMATRPQVSRLSTSLAALRQIFAQATERLKNDAELAPEDYDEVIESVTDILQKKIVVRITAQTAAEIRGAVELAKEFDLTIVLDGCQGLEPFKTQFAQWKPFVKAVILAGETPGQISNPNPTQTETPTRPWDYARELIDAGIPVAIRTRTDNELRRFSFVAAQFMQDQLDTTELLASVTSTPAALMNVDDQIGTLAKGKRADFVVLDGRPFGLHTRVQATYMGGEAQFERTRDATTTVVQADRVYLGDGKFADDASVVVKGKTVRGVGTGVSAPLSANVKSFGDGAVIVPGFVDMGTGLGLGGQLRGTISLQTKLSEQLYSDDPAIEFARRHGITTALLAQSSATRATPVVAFKLGNDTRVIGDPVAIRFRFSGDTETAIASNDRSLRAAKAYADSFIKYEKDLAEYKVKLKEWEASQKESAKKPAPKKEDEKKEADKKKAAEADKKKTEEKKEPEKDKPKEKDKKEKPLPDPISGTWEGELDSERLPPQIRAFQFELVLDGDDLSGTVTLLRSPATVVGGSYDRKSKELVIKLRRRESEIELKGKLDDEGNFTGVINLGRLGEIQMNAKRTVDKSKKEKPEDKPEKDEKEKPEKKDKPEDKKEKPGDKPEDKKEKPESKDEKKDDKKESGDSKDDKKEESKSDEKEKKEEEKKPEKPKEPRKPRVSSSSEPYRDLFAGKIPAIVEARDLNSIKATVDLFAKKYKLRTIILGADSIARDVDLLNNDLVSVCVGPTFSVTIDGEPVNVPQVVANEQVRFGFQSAANSGSGLLPSAIQYSVSQGLSTTDALDGLSIHPANMLSKDMSFGKLAAGKDADLVVLSGDPFEHSTKVLAVMIDGVWVYEHEEQK